jgi:RNA polymerase sigma factor (sigma-70 family)
VTASWEDQLRELVHGRGQALVRYAFVLCGEQARAEDLVQTAITRTFARRRAVDDPEAYVRRAVMNAYLDEQRRHRLFRRRQPVLATPVAYELYSVLDDRHDVLAVLAVLSPQQRACITLRYLCDQTVDEVARVLECSPGNVKRHVHDGLARLRLALDNAEEREHG